MPKPSVILIALAALAPAHAINKCVDAKGTVTYTDAPCPSTQKSSAVKVYTTAGFDTKPPAEYGIFNGTAMSLPGNEWGVDRKVRLCQQWGDFAEQVAKQKAAGRGLTAAYQAIKGTREQANTTQRGDLDYVIESVYNTPAADSIGHYARIYRECSSKVKLTP